LTQTEKINFYKSELIQTTETPYKTIEIQTENFSNVFQHNFIEIPSIFLSKPRSRIFSENIENSKFNSKNLVGKYATQNDPNEIYFRMVFFLVKICLKTIDCCKL